MHYLARNFLFLGLFSLVFPLSAEPTLWDFIYRQWAETMLLRAASKGDLDAVKYYLSRGCNINTRSFPVDEGYTPLANATIHDQHEVVKYLLQQKAHTNTCTEGGTLKIAMRHKTIHTPFTVLLWSKPDKNEIENVLKIVDKFNDGSRKSKLQSMLVDFKKWVNENLEDKQYCIGGTLVATERRDAHKFE